MNFCFSMIIKNYGVFGYPTNLTKLCYRNYFSAYVPLTLRRLSSLFFSLARGSQVFWSGEPLQNKSTPQMLTCNKHIYQVQNTPGALCTLLVHLLFGLLESVLESYCMAGTINKITFSCKTPKICDQLQQSMVQYIEFLLYFGVRKHTSFVAYFLILIEMIICHYQYVLLLLLFLHHAIRSHLQEDSQMSPASSMGFPTLVILAIFCELVLFVFSSRLNTTA